MTTDNTDDVVLTAIGQLDTPIWRRRRERDGYDAIFVDETHLFNINELHVFHHFTRTEQQYPIAYSVDRSQAVGDHGWTNEDISSALTVKDSDAIEISSSRLGTVFRSSPQIVSLAFSVVSSGATLFTNFDNPLDAATSSFTMEEERISEHPCYRSYVNETALVEGAFERAEQLLNDMSCKRSDILIVSLDSELIIALESHENSRNKPHILLKKRGDVEAVEAAEKSGQLVLAHADYVGGLEFLAVIIVGIDAGRIPPTSAKESDDSKNFQTYSSHNRLYVAISRARYRVEILGEKSRGPSPILQSSIDSKFLNVIE